MKFVAIIPSRYASSRFPGKPLALIDSKPMIQHVYERVSNVKAISDVYVATDDERIYDCVKSFNGKAIMTGNHSCGSNRLAEAASKIQEDFDVVVNIQGDEPLIKTEMVEDLISAFDDPNVYMSTLKKLIDKDNTYEIENPNIVKVVTDKNNDAIYFSRYSIPFNRDNIENVKYYKHVGAYAYKKDFLMKYSQMESTYLEDTEKLEQLRVLENGYKIRVIETKYQSIGVDLKEQIKIVEEELKKEKNNL